MLKLYRQNQHGTTETHRGLCVVRLVEHASFCYLVAFTRLPKTCLGLNDDSSPRLSAPCVNPSRTAPPNPPVSAQSPRQLAGAAPTSLQFRDPLAGDTAGRGGFVPPLFLAVVLGGWRSRSRLPAPIHGACGRGQRRGGMGSHQADARASVHRHRAALAAASSPGCGSPRLTCGLPTCYRSLPLRVTTYVNFFSLG